MNKSIIVLMMSALLIVSLPSCKDDDSSIDNTKPTINAINLLNQPDGIFQAGDTIVAQYATEDDVDLSELIFEIHHNFDGHSHMKANMRWSTSFIAQIFGQTSLGELRMPVPLDAASGPYHLEAIVLDKAGNRSDVFIVPIEIVQDGQPTIQTISLPESIQAGGDLDLVISFKDDVDLTELVLELIEESAEQNGLEPFWSQDVDLDQSNDTDYQVNEKISLTKSKSGETYHLKVSAADNDDNHIIKEFEINIK